MSNIVPASNAPQTAYELALVGGDLSKLSPDERLSYYKATCESLGLNPLTRPFDYIMLNGKLTLYARKDATDQLRASRKVSITIKSREQVGDLVVVTAHAALPDGRTDESIGAVSVAGLKGDALANALMKAETKARRRVTLSICGLGLSDESELEGQSFAKQPPKEMTATYDPGPEEAERKVVYDTYMMAIERATTKEDLVVIAGDIKGSKALTTAMVEALKAAWAAKAKEVGQ